MKEIIRTILLAVSLLLILNLSAQDKQLTFKDAAYMNPDVRPKSLSQLQWMGASENFAFVHKNRLVKINAASQKTDTILNLKDINAQLKDLEIKELKRFPKVSFIDDNTFRFSSDNKILSFNVENKNLQQLNSYGEDAENIDIETNTFNIAYTIDNNLYVSVNEAEIGVTDDTEEGIVNGQEVHRREFGIEKGTFWSPKGNYLAFYRKDETMVADYPLVNIDNRIAEVENSKYPMAGEKSHHVTIGLFNPASGKTIFLKTGKPEEQYLTNISWGPGEKLIYVAVLNRDQNHMKLNSYDVMTGEFVKTLFEERDDKYVEPEHGMYFVNSNPNQFLWMSERDGYDHLYLYDISGDLIKQLTKGDWVVKDFLGFDTKGSKACFTATKDSPLERQVYTVNLNNGKITKLSSGQGSHKAVFNADKKYFIDVYSSFTADVCRRYSIITAKGKTLDIILDAPDPMKDYQLGETSLLTLKSSDNKDLYCRLIKPSNFDPSKKYPVFIYVYGGPHAQLVTDAWLAGGGLFLNLIAQKGYVVFTLDNRGSANRGRDFEQAIFRDIGTVETEDQMKGVEYLKSLDYVDTDRIGVNGWSYGGFMTISLLTRYPDVFKVGVAGGPVIDWKYYEVMYGERYMDTPQDNPEGYENSSLLNRAQDLQSKLLIIHGAVDPTVVWQNSLDFVKKCVDEGVQVDYMVYPQHKHNVRGKDRIHLYEKIFNYFEDYL